MKILDADNILKYFEDGIINKIGEKWYNWDARLKYVTLADVQMDSDGNKLTGPGVNANLRSSYLSMCNGNRLEWTRRWLNERIVYMDSVYQYGDFMKSNIVLRSQSHTGPTTIKIKTYSPQRVTIRFSDANTSESIITKRCTRYNSDITATDGWYEFNGTILNAIDNNITIVGGHNVMSIGGLEDIDLASLKLSSAPKLTTLNIPGAKSLIELEVSNNYMLQEIDLSGCEKLGTLVNYQAVDLTSAPYLRKLDVSNSKLRSIAVNPNGGVLEEFNISNSFVTGIILNKQPYLEELDLASCTYLSEVDIQNCESMKRIVIPGTRISKFKIADLPEITYVDISATSQLSSFSAINCPKLERLKMQNITSTNIKTLDLVECTGLVAVDITNSPLIKRIRFHENMSKIKELYLSSSGIVDIQYGNADTDGWLDLSKFSLTALKVNNCQNLVKVKGITLNTSSGGTFSNCSSLQIVRGTIKLTGGGANGIFSHCYKLEEFPEPGNGANKMDIDGVTDASSMFYDCKKITFQKVLSVLRKLRICKWFGAFAYYSGVVVDANMVNTDDWQHILWNIPAATNIDHMFGGCNIAEYQPRDDFFEKSGALVSMSAQHGKPLGKMKGRITNKLLEPLVNLEYIQNFFSGCTNITEVDEYCLARCTKLKSAWSLFSGCTNMNIVNGNQVGFGQSTVFLQAKPDLNNVDYFFSGCKNITGYVPGNIFSGCTSLVNCKEFFRNCSNLEGEIPAGIFNYGRINNIDRFFSGCSKLTGPIRSDIWSTNNNIIYAAGLFENCSSLGGDSGNDQEVAEDFFANKTKLASIGYMFKGCTNLRFRLINGWFRDLRDLNNIDHLFDGCQGLSGTIPEQFFYAVKADGVTPVNLKITAAEAVFSNCSGLNGKIPRDLFQYFTEVQSLNNFFYNCWRLTGRIPEYYAEYEEVLTWDEQLQMWISERHLVKEEMGLFDNCGELLKCASMFYYCSGIGKTPTEVTEADPYCVPNTMFAHCPKLIDCNNMFFHWAPPTDSTRVVNTLYGEVPPDLFKGCYQLQNTSSMFAYQGQIKGTIPASFFKSQDSRLKNTSGMFVGCSLQKLETCFLKGRHTGMTHTNSMFYGCGQMVGTAKPIIDAIDYIPNHAEMFLGCGKLTDFNAEYMAGWK